VTSTLVTEVMTEAVNELFSLNPTVCHSVVD